MNSIFNPYFCFICRDFQLLELEFTLKHLAKQLIWELPVMSRYELFKSIENI